MSEIEAVVTTNALTWWPQYFGRLTGSWDPRIKYFRIGEGGWIDPGTGVRTRRAPDGSLTDLDCVVNPSRYPADSRYYYEGTFASPDTSYVSPYILQAEVFLDYPDGNNDGFGHSPEFWEIGLYTDDPVTPGAKMLVAYGTMQEQVKNVSVQIDDLVRIVFAAG